MSDYMKLSDKRLAELEVKLRDYALNGDGRMMLDHILGPQMAISIVAELRELRGRFRCGCGREKTEPECPVCDNDE